MFAPMTAEERQGWLWGLVIPLVVLFLVLGPLPVLGILAFVAGCFLLVVLWALGRRVFGFDARAEAALPAGLRRAIELDREAKRASKTVL